MFYNEHSTIEPPMLTSHTHKERAFDNFSFSLVYLPIKAPTHEQNNLKNTNTTKHIYRVPVIQVTTVLCVGDATYDTSWRVIQFLFP